MKGSSIVIGTSVAILTICLWAFFNRPEQEPEWPPRIQGFSFSPLHANHDPVLGKYPTESQLEADLALLAGKTHAIRTYTVVDVLEKIPALAKEYKINVAVGAWVDGDRERDEAELKRLIGLLGSPRNVVRVLVGNEVVLRGDVPIETLIGYLDRVRKVTDIPVSTGEPWHVWIKHPELVDHVDYIAAHMLPYWEGIHIDHAVDHIVRCMEMLRERFPGKPIVIAEVGWPSNGRTRVAAVASVSNEAAFLRRFLERAQKEKYIYYVMEAFDQPWKRGSEGAVGAYWGVYNAGRQPKFSFTAPIVPIPRWYILAGISVVLAAIVLTVLFIDSQTLHDRGRGFLALIAYACATAAVWIVYDYVHQYLTVGTILVGTLMLIGMTGIILVLLTEAHEWAEALWFVHRRRSMDPVSAADPQTLPFVSVHVPAYNEPPEMLRQTLDALAELDYPHFEVLVVDNNTRDPGIWEPVRDHCRQLGERFRFFHVDPLAGFKAGALNYAFAQTASEAEIIAVIDSDYRVAPDWLKSLAPHFENPAVAVVQAPQDYRDDQENAFKAMCYTEYRGFFYIGMITRNERNAIIQHGTMTMVRKSVLSEIGGWAEWCITEDAELGLRIFEQGYEAVYIPKSFGKGVMPDTLADYMKQRYRWAYGAIRILRRHAGQLLGFRKSRLTPGQRYHFLSGWLPWIADGLNLVFNAGALAWSAAMIAAPQKVDPPLMELSLLPLSFFAFKMAKMYYLNRSRMSTTYRQTAAAAFAGLALSHAIAKAVLKGFFTSSLPFFRTPKWARKNALLHSLVTVWQEALIMLALWGAAAGVYMRRLIANPDLNLWLFVLIVQSLPYLVAVMVAIIGGLPRLPAWILGRLRPMDGH